MKPISRATGRTAVAAAAYRSGERLVSAADGRVHDFRTKSGVEHAEIVLPKDVDAPWALDRSALWNAADRAEKRRDARVAREFEVALPHELTPEQRLALTRTFAQDLANRFGTVADFAIHSPSGETDIRNHHAHILLTTRTVTAEGLGEKTQIERSNTRLLSDGFPTSHMQLREIRQGWEHRANEHLALAGCAERMDHRSHAERGLEIAPTQHMGVHATDMQRRGKGVSRARLDEEAARANAEAIRRRPEQVLELVTSEKSVFDRHDVARALHRAIDDPQAFQNAFAQVMASEELVELRGEVRNGQGHVTELARYSTREMIAVEAGMIDRVGRMADGSGHGVDRAHVERSFASRTWLTEEQRDGVLHVTGEGRLAAVIGIAGAGKSTMLTAAREAWEGQGYRVHGAALAGKAAEGLEESSSIRSRTLASWEYGWSQGRDALRKGDVFVIDEAGMVSSRQLARVTEAVDRAGAKLVLVGDPEQLQPIQAGAAFRAVTERIGFAELTEVRRQREPWQRTASAEFAKLRIEAGLAAYESRGAIRFSDTRDAARGAIIASVMADHDRMPDASQLILTYRRADVRELNEAIRGERQARGELMAERTYQTNDGERRFAVGDRILFLDNNRDLGVKNGMLGTVEVIREGEIVARLDEAQGPGRKQGELGRQVVVPVADYTKFDHGYATTIHKAQGATVDRAYVLASNGMDSHLAYVAMTRHRDGVELHAGRDDFQDMKALVGALSHANTKETTLDYAERRGIEVDGRRGEEGRSGDRAPIVLTGAGSAERKSMVLEPKPACDPEPERRSIEARLTALVGWSRSGPEDPVVDRAPSPSPDCTMLTPERVEERCEAPSGIQAEGRAPLSVQERLATLRTAPEGREAGSPSEGRSERSGVPDTRSIQERLAELRTREITPEERQRSRERDRERDRGGHER